MTRRKALPLVVLGLVFTLSACSSDDIYLPALLADPLASYEGDGIELIDAWQEAEGRDIIMDMPTHAEVGRTYRIEDQSQVDRVLTVAVAYAESQGWRIQEDITVPTLFTGSKPLPPGDGILSIALSAADPIGDPDGPRILSVLLEFGSVGFDDTITSSAAAN